jgi:LacI family transcriptional regulator
MRVPCFVLGAEDNPDAPYIKIDRKGGICKAVEYLMSYGHRRIGFIGDSQEIKVQGYKEALYRNELEFSNEDILPAYATWEDGYMAMRNYNFTANSPTAFIGLNNLITKGAMRALFEKGFNVPKDISLIGYDNSPDMQYVEVAITTVGPSLEELTSQAADLIVSLVQGENVAYPVVIESKLYERNSVAAPSDKRNG